jgi:hypothetical protein
MEWLPAMPLKVIRATALRVRPADTAEILRVLFPGEEMLGAQETAGEWIMVSCGRDTGWVLARDCQQIPLDIKYLAAMRQQAVATPVGAPAALATEIEPDSGFESFRRETERLSQQADPSSRETAEPRSRPSPGLESASPAADTPASDTVDVSVFGPQTLRVGGECLVQVYLHTRDQSAAAAALAREADPASARRGVKTLATEIARGTRVQVILEGRGLAVDAAMQELTWRGEPDACQFMVSALADATGKTFYPRILVLLNSVPVGTVTFALSATAEQTPTQTTVIRGDEARRYQYAFLSYSSSDRAEVLKRAQGLKAGRIDFFQDLLSLEPGEHWAPRLYQEIDRCDLFLLFWSSQAKASPWVMKEVEYALARQKSSSGGLPDITPVIIEGPPPPPPPDSLKDIHFNDSLIYVLATVEAQGQRPKPA